MSPISLSREAATERERRVLQLIGLARRAGRAVVGTQAAKDAALRGELALVVLAVDATENARKRLGGLAGEEGPRVIRYGTRAALGRAVGRDEAVVVGIRDRGLGARIEETASGAGELPDGASRD